MYLKGEMDRLMKETETLQHQAKVFKIDADQFAMALQQQQEENRELKTKVNNTLHSLLIPFTAPNLHIYEFQGAIKQIISHKMAES